MYNFEFSVLSSDYIAILQGIWLTVFISVIASVFAFILGTVFVYFRISPQKLIRNSVDFFVSCVRNTPLLIFIFLFYKGLPTVGIVFSAITCGILGLGIYSAAYISDALLAGVNAVPEEHFQTAKALGLTRFQSFIHVVYPQALRHSTFILGSQFMNLIKNSSLVSFISVADLFYVTYKGIADTFRIYEYFILAIVVYCSLTGLVLLITNKLQKRFAISRVEVLA